MPKRSLIAFVLRGKNRVKILKALETKEKISARLEKETGMYKSHISRTLKELRTKGLIKCTNPQDRDFRFYKLNKKGKEVLKKVKT